MKKLHLLAFYALIAPAITLATGPLLAAPADSETPDLGEQDMGSSAVSDELPARDGKKTTKSKYNAEQTTSTPADQTDGKVEAVLVASGEFLGLGEQPRAISWEEFQMPENLDDRRPKAPSNLTVE